MSLRAACRFFWLLVLTLGPVAESAGHFLNVTRCSVEVDAATRRIEMDLRVDFTRLLGDPVVYYELSRAERAASEAVRQQLIESLQDGLTLMAGEKRLELEAIFLQLPDLPLQKFTEPWAAPMSELQFEALLPEGSTGLTFVAAAGLAIEYPLVLTLKTSGAGAYSKTRWLEPGQVSPSLTYSLAPSQSVEPMPATAPSVSESFLATALRYLVLGYRHILPLGLDHILFVCGLYFLNNRWRTLLLQVSLFTLAHTLTLMLTAVGVLPYHPAIVEPLIALSIVYVGVENIWRTELKQSRVLVVTAFGLIHGMGFAGMLGTFNLGREEFLTALLAFNVGVEFGQLSILLIAAALCGKLHGWKHYRLCVRLPANLSISIVALVWFIQRVL